jgi:hypothetical protein
MDAGNDGKNSGERGFRIGLDDEEPGKPQSAPPKRCYRVRALIR